jgi:hypothetical protein
MYADGFKSSKPYLVRLNINKKCAGRNEKVEWSNAIVIYLEI